MRVRVKVRVRVRVTPGLDERAAPPALDGKEPHVRTPTAAGGLPSKPLSRPAGSGCACAAASCATWLGLGLGLGLG